MFKNIRFYILASNTILAGLVYYYIQFGGLTMDLKNLRLTKIYGFLGLFFLYLTLLISPIYSLFEKLPFKKQVLKSQRALGVSAFLFSFLHSFIGFFNLVEGFIGFYFLSNNYQLSLILGLISLLLLFILALTSLDLAVKLLGKYWKKIHQTIYVLSILIIIHIQIVGTHFRFWYDKLSITTNLLLLILLFLEAFRIDKFLGKKFGFSRWFGPVFIILLLSLMFFAGYFWLFPPAIGGENQFSQHLHNS